MAENTKIQWTDHTFNPWLGCTKISPACAHCYAEGWAKRSGLVKWGDHLRRRTSAANWREPLKWNCAAEKAGERRRVFCASLADVFEDREELKPWRYDLFRLIEQTPNLDWLLLTKRPENCLAFVPWMFGAPWPNVWLGATVEDQSYADERIPWLLSCSAVVHFLSCEPLLESVRLDRLGPDGGPYAGLNALTGEQRGPHEEPGFSTWLEGKIDWVIVGGESGPNARPMNTDHLIALRDQCVNAGTPVFVKQMGSVVARKFGCRDAHGGDPAEWPAEYRIRQFPVITEVAR